MVILQMATSRLQFCTVQETMLVVSETCTHNLLRNQKVGELAHIHQHVAHESTYFAKQVNNYHENVIAIENY